MVNTGGRTAVQTDGLMEKQKCVLPCAFTACLCVGGAPQPARDRKKELRIYRQGKRMVFREKYAKSEQAFSVSAIFYGIF